MHTDGLCCPGAGCGLAGSPSGSAPADADQHPYLDPPSRVGTVTHRFPIGCARMQADVYCAGRGAITWLPDCLSLTAVCPQGLHLRTLVITLMAAAVTPMTAAQRRVTTRLFSGLPGAMETGRVVPGIDQKKTPAALDKPWGSWPKTFVEGGLWPVESTLFLDQQGDRHESGYLPSASDAHDAPPWGQHRRLRGSCPFGGALVFHRPDSGSSR